MIAAVARRVGSLSASGQWAAFATGTLATAAGWGWSLLLIAYFVLSSALTRLGAAEKARRTESTLPLARGRNAVQVLANGGVYAVCVAAGALLPQPALAVAGAGALAAAAADTWATELGVLWGGTPRALLTGRPLPAGASGGVTLVGLGASVLAALLVAGAAVFVVAPAGTERTLLFRAVVLAGVAGSLLDSLVGATLQSKRWCERCRTWTERRVHTCQYRTQHARGLRWMTNDTVNLLATLGGALIALLLADVPL